jgi:glucose-6-phosphate 1-dehydrogenase
MSIPKQPTILVILGVTGDLAAKKILPALFNSFVKGELPPKFTIVGFGRREYNDHSFQVYVKETVQKRIHPSGTGKLDEFAKLFTYQQGLFEDVKSYEILKNKVEQIEPDANVPRLFYLSVPPNIYEVIFDNFQKSKLVSGQTHSRILVEKPFGRDLKTAQALDKLLTAYFEESKIYRIDHYLGKKLIQEILNFRIDNNLFAPEWGNNNIQKIEIRLWQTEGVEHRGAFYDSVGAFRDMGQNHILQMLALITMEQPEDFTTASIHQSRAKLLNELKIWTEHEAATKSIRSQYLGYDSITGVLPHSQTETYFKVIGEIDNDNWRGVPVVMESGKRMHEQRKEAVITFKNGMSPTLFELEPIERIVYGPKETKFKTPHEHIQYVAEYEKLLLDAIRGDRTLFVSTEEVQAMWKFTDVFVQAWNKGAVPLKAYEPDTDEAIKESQELVI